MVTDSYRIVVTGDAQAAAAFRKLALEAGDLSGVFGRIAEDAATEARALAPKRSGALAGSVKPTRAKTKAVISAGGTSVPYAGPINYGWPARNIRAALFMQHAADDRADSSAELIADEIQRLIDRAGLG